MKGKQVVDRINRFVSAVDRKPLWLTGWLLFFVIFIPLYFWGENCTFPIHDQLDETILSYVLNARHMGTGDTLFPEILGGINVSGMQPSAVLFIPLYRIFSVLTAFLIQYSIVFLCGFFGMYLAVKELTGSSILALAMGGCFCMLPLPPVYGLSAAGVPLLFWCCVNFWNRKRIGVSLLLTLFFGLTSHLLLVGYVILGFWALACFWALAKRKCHKWMLLGFLELTLTYILVNRDLFLELFLGKGEYVSHREEFVNGAAPFWRSVDSLFLHGLAGVDSLHEFLILPVLIMLVLGGIFYGKMSEIQKQRYRWAIGGGILIVAVTVLFAICRWQPLVDLRNRLGGILHYLNMDRFYWVYPAAWYLEFGLCFSLWGSAGAFKEGKDSQTFAGTGRRALWVLSWPVLHLVVLGAVLWPTLQTIKINSYVYRNVNQYNNGSGITGYLSWKSFYAEELMRALDAAIGRDKADYRIGHLGMSPTPALMYGFYTVDGYSNNYPLEYKHRFRKVIAREMEQAPETAAYFDTWGSRCYLFNAESGSAYMLGKRDRIVYRELDFDMEALKGLGCEYLFSCGEIRNAEDLGLRFMGYFETEDSYWGVWLYQL